MLLTLALRQISLFRSNYDDLENGSTLALCIVFFVLSGEDPVEVNRARTDRRR